MNPTTYPNLVIYHKDCFDGLCSAWVYRLWLKANKIPLELVEFIAMSHDKEKVPESASGKRVALLDFCFDKQETLDQLTGMAQHVLIIDHHKSTTTLDFS